jgi:hypothetical protein
MLIAGHGWRCSKEEDRVMTGKAKALGLALALVAVPLAIAIAQPTPQDLVDALNSVFGKHAGMRAAHTKGICVTGNFTPGPEAAKLSKAPHSPSPFPSSPASPWAGGIRRHPTRLRTMCAASPSASTSATVPILTS